MIAVAGRPNVGKSTLVNALCGTKVSIVSDRAQTTRRRIAGVVHGDGVELVLLDLPGFQRPRDGLTARMQRTVDESLADVDLVLFVVDGTSEPGAGDRFIAGRVFGAEAPVVVAVNKIDQLDAERIAVALVRYAELGEYAELYPTSAETGRGVAELRAGLAALAPEGPALFGPEIDSSDPLELRIAELVREQALVRTREELPHAVAVVVEEIESGSGRRKARIACSIVCETESQKRILIGRGGDMVRAIGVAARPAVEELYGEPVMLDLRVRVRRGWRDDEGLLRRLDG